MWGDHNRKANSPFDLRTRDLCGSLAPTRGLIQTLRTLSLTGKGKEDFKSNVSSFKVRVWMESLNMAAMNVVDRKTCIIKYG